MAKDLLPRYIETDPNLYVIIKKLSSAVLEFSSQFFIYATCKRKFLIMLVINS